jgi:hypothetical protein
MRRLNPHTWNAKVSALSLTFALIVSASASFAQIANFAPLTQPSSTQQSPATLTLKDALALAAKDDPALLAAASDAASAREDRKQARAALYPSLSGRSEYLGTQGNGKLPESRFVTNDGVHVYRDWAVAHQDLSPGTLRRGRLPAHGCSRGARPRQNGNRTPEPRSYGHEKLLCSDRRSAQLPSRLSIRLSALSPSARSWNAAGKWRMAMWLSRNSRLDRRQDHLTGLRC